jgi:glucosyl-3-phosphoglycerate synthase
MDVEQWFSLRRYKGEDFSDIDLLIKKKHEKKYKISVCIPTLNEENNIAKVVRTLKNSLHDKKKLIDEIVVIDSGSKDKTKEEAIKAGAKFVLARNYLKKYGRQRGKGENLWKSLYICKGDIICWIDADIENIHPRFVYGLIGPLIMNDEIKFSKAFYERPIKVGKKLVSYGGGRVTELTAKPLFSLFYPKLSGFVQPLSGEYAGKREILEKIPFYTGYSVETAMLIDIVEKFGLEACAQIDLEKRVHRNQLLIDLGKMSFVILSTFLRKTGRVKKEDLEKVGIYTSITKQDNEYKIKKVLLEDIERPAIIELPEYNKKFKEK